MTILEVLTSATDYLTRQGVGEARLNAEHLLAHSLGMKRLDLYLEFDRPLSDEERAPLRETVRLRSQGVPLQHLLGTVEFCGHPFDCDARALIPRPETELLVEHVRSALNSPAPLILDVGTGSGVIGVTLAILIPDARIEATDLSSEALELARSNAARHGLESRIVFFEADLLPPGGAGKYDVIVANLPYIPTGELSALAREVQHDPAMALDGGADGLESIRRLVETASARLNPGGMLWLEIGQGQAGAVMALLQSADFGDVRPLNDYAGIARFVSGARKADGQGD